MKWIGTLLLAGLAPLSLASPSTSQTGNTASTVAPPTTTAPAMSQALLLSPSQRSTIARDLIAKWQSASAKRPGGDGPRWARILAKAVASADAANVLQATNARSVDEIHAALIGVSIEAAQPTSSTETIGNGAVAPQVLGSYTNDLVYTPLPNGRCRIADSRVINSPLVGTRSLLVEDVLNYTSQGGNGTYAHGTGSANCGINYYTAAYALSITLISPAASGQFKVFRYGQPYQTGSSVSMNAGSPFASADLIVRSCQGCAFEIGLQSLISVHYVIDVIGYYMPPLKTPLSCVNTTFVYQDVVAGGTATLGPNACQTGYTETSITCVSSNWFMPLVQVGDGYCAARNNSGDTATISARRRCCQIPGR